MNRRTRSLLAWAWLAGACGPAAPESTASTSGNGSDGATTTPVTTGQASLDDPGTTTTLQGSTGDIGFIGMSDTPWPVECDIWNEDCPRGEKCMPWANDGGSSWNATKCVPLAVQPDGVGEPCTALGSGTSGIDSCDIHSMCWNVDSETLEGICQPFCVGPEVNPSCEDACSTCNVSGNASLILCLPQCDPLGQDCPDGQACFLWQTGFGCAPDVSGERGGAGESCEFDNACDPGLQCAAGESVAGCEDPRCCTPFCAVENPSACDALPGSVCTPHGLRDPGCFGDGVGQCLLP